MHSYTHAPVREVIYIKHPLLSSYIFRKDQILSTLTVPSEYQPKFSTYKSETHTHNFPPAASLVASYFSTSRAMNIHHHLAELPFRLLFLHLYPRSFLLTRRFFFSQFLFSVCPSSLLVRRSFSSLCSGVLVLLVIYFRGVSHSLFSVRSFPIRLLLFFTSKASF